MMLKPDRALAFSDGVFAVVITLLVIDLRLPGDLHAGDEAAVFSAILAMRQKVAIFVFTFIIVGMSWLGHHQKFSHVRQVDHPLLWMNLFYLMALCLVPFATSVLSEHGGRAGLMLYASVMALLLLLSCLLSVVSLRERFVGGLPPGAALRHDMIISPLLNALIFLGSAAMAAGNLLPLAHWMLLAIIPVSAYFGRRARAA